MFDKNIFFYRGYFQNGKIKFGFIREEKEINENEIRKILKKKSIFVKNIYKISNLFNLSLFKEKQRAEDILNLFAESQMFIKNGYSFFKVLEILEENKNLKKYIEKMKISMKKGESMYEIFKNSGVKLKNTEFMIIKAGEESGNICRAFEIIQKGIQQREENRKAVQKIMIYPSVILVMVVLLILFLGVYILPDFIKIIESSGKELPMLTKIILWGSRNFLFILLIIFISIFFVTYVLKSKNKREILFQKLTKIHIFKIIIDKIFIAVFSDTLAVLLNSGITITMGINLIKNESEYRYFSEKLTAVENELKRGSTIYSAFKNIKIFTGTEEELIKAGEEAGELVEVLELISQRTKNEIKQKTDIGIKLLEPFTIIIIGIIVGTVFLGIYMPVFQMMDSI